MSLDRRFFKLCRCYRILSSLIVKGKCPHEGDGDIEQERTEEVNGVKPSRDLNTIQDTIHRLI